MKYSWCIGNLRRERESTHTQTPSTPDNLTNSKEIRHVDGCSGTGDLQRTIRWKNPRWKEKTYVSTGFYRLTLVIEIRNVLFRHRERKVQ